MAIYKFVLNGEPVECECEPQETLLTILRERFDLTGTKESCGKGECGACTVIMNGQAVNSCLVLAGQLEGRKIITIEGLAKGEELDHV